MGYSICNSTNSNTTPSNKVCNGRMIVRTAMHLLQTVHQKKGEKEEERRERGGREEGGIEERERRERREGKRRERERRESVLTDYEY